MTALSINNVISISVAAMNRGFKFFNTSNLALVTSEPVISASIQIDFGAVAASGAFTLKFGDLTSASIAYNATAIAIQDIINALAGLENVIVTGSISSLALVLTQAGQFGAIPIPTFPTNTLEDAGTDPVTLSARTLSSGWSGGSLGYAVYNDPQQVGIDFGTSSKTFLMADAVFSQQPNILNGNGQFIALLSQVNQQTLTFSGVAASGNFTIEYDGNTTTSLAWNATTAQIQAALRLLPGLAGVTVSGAIANQLLTVILTGVYANGLALTTPANTLATSAPVAVTITIADSVIGETYGETIARTQGLVQYFGVMPSETLTVIGQTDMLAAAAITLPLNIIGAFVSYNTSDIQPGGKIDLLQSGTFNNSRGLYYGDSSNSGINALLMMASYMGLGLSVNFSGSNTTMTMHLKTLRGIQPDPTMTQTILNLAQAAGADCYVSIQGDPVVFTSGANKFFDQVYNLEWFVGALQIAGFNYLAQSATKVPQTESGMDGLKSAYGTVAGQAVTNQYVAPGAWTSSTTFGNQLLFLQNIAQFGYYIYSTPISKQLAADRQSRISPLVQIAVKEAGAIQKSDVLVYVNP